MDKNITEFEELLTEVKAISDHENFETFCNTREFEQMIASKESRIDFNEKLHKDIIEFIDKNIANDNKLCYVLFFLLFTLYRRKRIGNMELFTNTYLYKFKQYPSSEFIELLTIYSVKKDNERLHELLIRSKRLSESKGATYDFTKHSGINNFYVEVVCTYFELNLDERFDEKSSYYIKDAIEKIDKAIMSCNGQVYSKFYLNKGRLEALKGNYDKGEEYIVKAIQEIGLSVNRSYTVNEYQYYLTKLDMMRLNDMNNQKMKEVEKVKIDNIKSLSLMTALLSFILGAINIFSSTTNILALGILMVTYLGLILTLIGVLLFGIKLLYREKDKKYGIYNLVIFIAGLIIFAVSIILIIKFNLHLTYKEQ